MLEVVAETYNKQTPLNPVATRLPADGGTVGRDADNTVVLWDPLNAVSRRHLRFARAADGGYEVANISSANHALVNDHNLVPGTRCQVRDQDRIQIGSFVLKIREVGTGGIDESALAAAPADVGAARHVAPVGNDVVDDPGYPEAPAAHPAPQTVRVSEPIADDFLVDPFDAPASAGSSAALFGGLSDADPDEVLDTTCSGPRCDDPMRAMDAHGIELTALSGKRDELVSGPPVARTADSLLADPLTEKYRNRPAADCADPLKMFGDAGESVFSGLGLFGDDEPLGMDESHHINHRVELSTPFAVPVAQAEPPQRPATAPAPQSIIPDDDFAWLADAHAAPVSPDVGAVTDRVPDLREPPASGRKPEVDLADFVVHGDSTQRGRAQMPGVSPIGGDDQPLPPPVSRSAPAQPGPERAASEALPMADRGCPAPAVREAAAPRPQTATPPAMTPVVTPVVTHAAPPAERNDASAEAELFRALLDGLGLSSLPDRDQLDPEFMRLLGRLLRAGTQGTIDLISARATVKREVRANVTVIAPERNNPLKFSPDSEVGLMYLLGRPYPGFMEPVEAMREAYADLYSHQMGIVSGMRSALGHVLERFDPETIATSAQRNGLIEGLLAVGRKARLWDAYGRYFQNTREQAEDRFQDFFGAVFLDAYDEVAGPREGRAARRKTGGE